MNSSWGKAEVLSTLLPIILSLPLPQVWHTYRIILTLSSSQHRDPAAHNTAFCDSCALCERRILWEGWRLSCERTYLSCHGPTRRGNRNSKRNNCGERWHYFLACLMARMNLSVGPSALTLSYLLDGNVPTYPVSSHPIPLVDEFFSSSKENILNCNFSTAPVDLWLRLRLTGNPLGNSRGSFEQQTCGFDRSDSSTACWQQPVVFGRPARQMVESAINRYFIIHVSRDLILC